MAEDALNATQQWTTTNVFVLGRMDDTDGSTAAAAEQTDPSQNEGTEEAASAASTGISLPYPRDFFGMKTAKEPSVAEAEQLWRYRKNRPKEGTVDREPPNGKAMLEEWKAMKNSLRDFVKFEHKNCAVEAAKKHKLLMPKEGQTPKTEKDLKDALSVLPCTNENQQKVWNVFFAESNKRQWLASCIDRWLARENMVLMDPASGADEKKRLFEHDRGGFSRIATQGKSTSTRLYMRCLLSAQGWCLQAANRKNDANKNHTMTQLSFEKGTHVWLLQKVSEIVYESKSFFCL